MDLKERILTKIGGNEVSLTYLWRSLDNVDTGTLLDTLEEMAEERLILRDRRVSSETSLPVEYISRNPYADRWGVLGAAIEKLREARDLLHEAHPEGAQAYRDSLARRDINQIIHELQEEREQV